MEGYSLPSDAQEVTVKDHIEYKKIDVADEVKKESEVNAAKEDTQVKTQTESVLQIPWNGWNQLRHLLAVPEMMEHMWR